MRVCGVVAEYNPFHNGHKYQLDRIREKGFDGVVAVMSGNAVQRGEFAFAEKHVRTRQALLNGVDLVIELPLPYVLSSAEKFAFGAVSVLDYLGVVDNLCFGSESGETDKLIRIAEYNTDGKLSNYLSEGVTYATALMKAVENELGTEYANILSFPNDILGIEYIKALKKLNSKIKPFSVKRFGSEHLSEKAENGFCSAQYIRYNYNKGETNQLMPETSYALLKDAIEKGEAPVTLKNNEAAALSILRQRDEEFFSHLPDISEGIENRLYSSVRSACSIDELYSLIKTKRYTLSRVRRLVMNAVLGITDDYSLSTPPYIRVLGFNENGREILRNAKLYSSKPIYTLYSDFAYSDSEAEKLYSLECRTSDLFYCFTPEIKPCGREQTENVVIIK